MAVEIGPLGTLAAEVMEHVESEFGDNAHVGVMAVIVEVDVDGEDDDDSGYTEVLYRCSDNRRWIQCGLFEAARRGVLDSDTFRYGGEDV